MARNVTALRQGAGTALAAGVATELLGATGVVVAGAADLAFNLKNTGAQPITALAAHWSADADGARWSQDNSVALPGGSLAAGATLGVAFAPAVGAWRRLRLVATSAAGSEATLDLSMSEDL